MAAGKAISPVGSKWQEDEHFSYNNTLVLRERAGGSTAGGGQLWWPWRFDRKYLAWGSEQEIEGTSEDLGLFLGGYM